MKNYRCLKQGLFATVKFTKLPFIFCIIAYVTIAGFTGIESSWGNEEKTKKEGPTQILTENSNLSAETLKFALEQKIAALKEEEMKLIQELMRNFPNSDEALVLIGDLYRRQGNSIEAMKFWEKALKVNPRRFDVYSAIGLVAFEKEQYENAVTAWRKALEINPDVRGLRNNLAQAFLRLGKHTEAIVELEKELAISSQPILSHYLLGRTYLQLKEFNKAKKHYEMVLELQPDHIKAYYGLASVYNKLKQSDKAKEYLTIFKKLKPRDAEFTTDRDKVVIGVVTSPQALAALAIGTEKLYRERGDLQRAEELLKRAQTLDPNNITCLESLASLYQMSNRITEALKQFDKIRKLQPKNSFCYLNIGILNTQLKRFDDAKKAFQKVIELAPKKSSGYCYLARLYLRSNIKLLEARRLAEKAIELEATADNYFVLSWACEVNGDMTSALAAIEKAIKLEPENSKYRQIYELIKKN